MRNVEINNQRVLDSLNRFKDFVVEKYYDGSVKRDMTLGAENRLKDRDYLVSDEHLQEIIAQGEKHNGYAVAQPCYAEFMANGSRDYNTDPETIKPYRDVSMQMNRELQMELSAQRNTLAVLYPPGGFISWHNNANAAGYNIIFTWSETGDGWFDYWDMEKQERVRVQDVPGWHCKMGYFGSYDNPDKLCYHAASTDSLRITVAYVFLESDTLWEDVIEDLEDPID